MLSKFHVVKNIFLMCVTGKPDLHIFYYEMEANQTTVITNWH